MSRTLTMKNVYDRKHRTFAVDGVWAKAFGLPESHGAWLVWGAEKNGKTWLSLKMADYLSRFTSVLYISAEEGAGKAFADTCQRIGISTANRRLKILEYTPIEEVDERLSRRKAPQVVFVDNLTIYNDELKNGVLRAMLQKHPAKLFVFVAHEDRGEPYTATAKMVRKLAKIIIHVKGLACIVSGRCPGGVMTIDEDRSRLFWGNEIKADININNNNNGN